MVGQTKTTTSPPLPAARARQLIHNPEEWIARAVEFAWQYHMIGTLRWLYTDENGAQHYAAQSRSNPQHPHHVVIDVPHEFISCSCPAFAHLNPCPHIGTAWYALRQAIAASLARNMVGQVRYEEFADWLERCGA